VSHHPTWLVRVAVCVAVCVSVCVAACVAVCFTDLVSLHPTWLGSRQEPLWVLHVGHGPSRGSILFSNFERKPLLALWSNFERKFPRVLGCGQYVTLASIRGCTRKEPRITKTCCSACLCEVCSYFGLCNLRSTFLWRVYGHQQKNQQTTNFFHLLCNNFQRHHFYSIRRMHML